MLKYIKQHLPALVAASVIFSGATYVAAQTLQAPSSSEGVSLVQDQAAASQSPANQTDPSTGAAAEAPGRPGGIRGGPPIRGELVVPGQTDGTFNTIKVDRGILKAVNGSTLTIDEADGTSVDIPTDANTRVGRDRQKSSVGDLVVGDHIFALREKSGDGFVTKGIRAISAENWSKFESQRQDRRAQRRAGRPGRGPANQQGAPDQQGSPDQAPPQA